MKKFSQQADEIIAILDDGEPLNEVYHLLKKVESMRTNELGPLSWPGCLVQLDTESEEWVVVTKHPTLDQHDEARYSIHQTLTPEEDTELRTHLLKTLNAWIREADRATKLTPINDKKQGSRIQPEHPITKWIRKHGHKYRYNTDGVKAYVEQHGGKYAKLYVDLRNDLKKNPLSKPKKPS